MFSREDYDAKELRDRRAMAMNWASNIIAKGKAPLRDLEKIGKRMVKFIYSGTKK